MAAVLFEVRDLSVQNCGELREQGGARGAKKTADLDYSASAVTHRGYGYHAIWAGDSRGYVLQTESGLCQLTQDDIKSKGDALENLIAEQTGAIQTSK